MSRKTVRPARMKTSTVVLLLMMLSIIICLSSFVVSINRKYSTGDYWYANSDKSLYQKVRLPARRTIVIENLNNCLLVSSDSLSLEVFNEELSNLTITSANDSVRIVSSIKSSRKLFLYLPEQSHLVATNSMMTMNGSLNYINPPSYSILLNNSRMVASAPEAHAFVQQLQISGNGGAAVEVSKRFHIHSLELTNTTSVSIAEGWQIGSLKTNFSSGLANEMIKVGDSVAIIGRRTMKPE